MSRNENPISVTWLWRPSCGAWHIENDPVSIGLFCPDGLTEDWWKDREPPE